MLPASSSRVSSALLTALAAGENAVLATLVRTSGSTYRKSGASLLVRSNGATVGLLSGGCLEREIAREALALAGGARSKLLHFDLTPDDDYLVGYGKGCAGQMWVLLEPVRGGLMQAQHEPREPIANALVVETGERVILDAQGRITTDLTSAPELLAAIVSSLTAGRRSGKALYQETTLESGRRSSWCGWYRRPVVDLLLFGAGLDAIPVCALAAQLGWSVRVCDHRKSMLRSDAFPGATALIRVDRDELPPLTAGPHTHVVIMTHDLLLDGRALVWAAERPDLPYIGLLGPVQRRERLLAMLRADGLDVMPRLAGRLRSPVGLDLGGDNEADIALAIVTQIQRDWHAATAKDKALAPR